MTEPARYSEEELLPISALQHLAFCRRQCALIHLDRLWSENRLTAEGRVLHDRVHQRGVERRGENVLVRGLHLRSLTLGVTGIADMVEFLAAGSGVGDSVRLPGRRGRWRPHPVEYKRGRPKKGPADRIQLCAQALCLEEMLSTRLSAGALFYGRTKRRAEVVFDSALRSATTAAARDLHALVKSGELPPAKPGKKCDRCSLMSDCLPEVSARDNAASRYLSAIIEQVGNSSHGSEVGS